MAQERQGFEFWINKDIRRRSFDLTLFHRARDGKESVACPLTMEAYTTDILMHPLLSLSPEEAEALITELWNAGVRPAGVGSSGELAAVKYHLEDMRKLTALALSHAGLNDPAISLTATSTR